MRMSKRADPHGLRSKHRSALRLCLGTAYYSARRYLLWMSGKYRFASQRQKDRLPCVHMAHHTPLLRKLKDVEMQYQHNKITNLKLAVARLDGGLCQLSNLIFWMTLHTPLEVKERHRHGYDVFPDSNRTQPFGSGATCFYPYGDLMIYNPTDRPFQLCLRVGETDLEGEWRSDRPPQFRYQIVERHHEMRHEWWGGCSRHNELYLQVFDLEGELLEDRLVVENHAMMMYTPFLEDNAPDGGREEEEK